jgi:hypothetical protein
LASTGRSVRHLEQIVGMVISGDEWQVNLIYYYFYSS